MVISYPNISLIQNQKTKKPWSQRGVCITNFLLYFHLTTNIDTF